LVPPTGGKAFGLLKAQQEERLDEINKVKGRPEWAEPGGWPWMDLCSYLPPNSNSWMIPSTALMRICSPNWKTSRVRGKL
jgi:hypothetical protein